MNHLEAEVYILELNPQDSNRLLGWLSGFVSRNAECLQLVNDFADYSARVARKLAEKEGGNL